MVAALLAVAVMWACETRDAAAPDPQLDRVAQIEAKRAEARELAKLHSEFLACQMRLLLR
jgi:hypothetical protein